MKTFKAMVEESDAVSAGTTVVANKSTKLKNSMKVKDGEEYKIRTLDADNVYLQSGNSSFTVSWKEFEKYFDTVKK